MVDRPMASISRAGRPKMSSAHLSVASKAVKPRAKSVSKVA